MMDSKVSVIIPSFNTARYIDQCVRSVVDNGYDNIEVLIIDDGSTDGTLEVLRAFEDDYRIKVIASDHKGVSAARNQGLSMSSGEYVCFVDSDDYIKRGCFARLVEVMSERRVDCMSFGMCIVLESKGKECVMDRRFPGCATKSQIIEGPFSALLGYSVADVISWNRGKGLTAADYGCIGGKIYRSSIIKEYAIRFNEQMRMKEDVYFNAEYLLHCNAIGHLDNSYYYYRIRADRGNAVANEEKDPAAVFRDKVISLRERERLSDLAGRSCEDYAGSVVLSLLQVALCCVRSPELSYANYKEYATMAGDCIDAIRWEPRNLKFNLPFGFIKVGAWRVLYCVIHVAEKTGLVEKLIDR